MNIERFLKAAQRESVLSIVDLDEAVDCFRGEVPYMSEISSEDISTLADILEELDREGYIVYEDYEALEEFVTEAEEFIILLED